MIRLLQYVACIPNTLVGLLLALAYGAEWSSIMAKDGAWHMTVKRAIGSPGAQTWGWLIFYLDADRIRTKELSRHELEHVYQALRCYGVPFMVAYGLEWCYWMLKPPSTPEGRPRWFRAYYRISWEQKARAAARGVR